ISKFINNYCNLSFLIAVSRGNCSCTRCNGSNNDIALADFCSSNIQIVGGYCGSKDSEGIPIIRDIYAAGFEGLYNFCRNFAIFIYIYAECQLISGSSLNERRAVLVNCHCVNLNGVSIQFCCNFLISSSTYCLDVACFQSKLRQG